VILPSRPRRCVARRLNGGGIFLLGLAGCATPQLQALVGGDSPGIPQRAEIGAVPFYSQDDYQCGRPLSRWCWSGGKAIEPEALRPQVYLPDRHGSLQIEMLAAARRNGFVAFEIKPNLSDLLTEDSPRETPWSCCRTSRWTGNPVWHYAVAIGYDLEARRITLRPATSGACKCRSAPSNALATRRLLGYASRCRRDACRRVWLQATI